MRIIAFLCIFLMSSVGFSQVRRAMALLDKNKNDDAYELLTKAVAKDSLAPAVKYILAKLFFTQDDVRYSIDSAYHYILIATADLNKTDEKARAKLSGNGFSPASFGQLKGEIERAGFIRAKESGQEQDYIDFLKQFPTSLYVESAIILRNIEAFVLAERINTYQSYQLFFETYPQAKEVSEAQNRYEKLLYDEKTKDGKLLTYQKFLREFPITYHRHEAELNIYNIITGRNSAAAYREFVELYPQSFLKSQALKLQYGLLDHAQQEAFLSSGAFTAKQIDSIYTLENLRDELIIPIIHNSEYQLINSKNEAILEQLNNISNPSKCELPMKNTILVKSREGTELINVSGGVIAKGNIISFQEERGVIKINDTTGQYFVSSSGIRTNNNRFKNAVLIGPYISFENNLKWGLQSITGIPMLSAKYDSIFAFHEHIVLKKDKKWGIFPVAAFYPLLDGEKIALNLTFDNISTLDDNHLSVVKEKASSLMDAKAQLMVPLAEQSVELVDDGYFIDRVDSLFDSRLSETWYNDINFNEYWTLGNLGETTNVYYQGQFLLNALSAKTVGLTAAIITSGDSTFCYFNDSSKIIFNEGESIVPIRRMGQNSTVRHFMHTDTRKKQRIYNAQGQRITVPKFDKLVDVGDKYMLSLIKTHYNLLNDDGKIILKEIEAATSLGNGYITFLRDKKFGLFDEDGGILIKAKYDRPIEVFADSLFMVKEEGKYGIVTRSDSILIPTNYDEIKKLDDAIAILKSNFRWIFWDIKQAKPLLNNVQDYWVYDVAGERVYKIFKGIGYGIWSPESGSVLSSTYGEITIVSKGDETVYIAEKWVEEADIVIMLYYDKPGKLFRKEVLSTAEYEDLTCQTDQD